MKKIYSLLIASLFVGGAFAADKTATVKFTAVAPEIDGFVEGTWDAATPEAITVAFRTEVATVTASWQSLWDDNNSYVLVNVEDDNHWPGWEAVGDSWLYDKPEIYWDVNAVLKDGGGAGNSAGHWQLADGFTDGMYDTPITKAGGASINPGGTYAYSLVGEGYEYEHAVPWANLKDNNGAAYVPVNGGKYGFDVTIIDQDEGITTGRQRMNWATAGVVDEAWNNMDEAGIITLQKGAVNTLKNSSMSVYPNPAIDNVTIKADFNRVSISNILGQQIKSISVKSNVVNISDLSKGVYVIKAYKNDKYVGTAKVTKN
jgi:hypothetical protein